MPVSHKLRPSLFYTQSQTSPHMNWALRSLQSNYHFWSEIVMNYKIWVANPWELNIFSSCHDSEGIAPSFEKMLILQKGSAGSRQHSGHLYFSFLFYYHQQNFIALCSPGSIWCSPRPHTAPHQPQCIASAKNGRPKTAQNNTYALVFVLLLLFFFRGGAPKASHLAMPPAHSANSWSAGSQMANVHSLTAKGVKVSIEEQNLYNSFGGVDISPPETSKK